MPRGLAAGLCVSAVLLGGTGSGVSGQDAAQELRFRVEASLIRVPVVVTDATGRPVRGLTAEDFEVRHAGAVQRIAQFVAIDRAGSPAAAVGVAPSPDLLDTVTRPAPATGRVFALVLDDTRADSAEVDQLSAHRVARLFIEHVFEEGDIATILTVSRRESAETPPTTNRAELLAALERGPLTAALVPPNQVASRVTQAIEATAVWLDEHFRDHRPVLVFLGDSVPGLGGFVETASPFMAGVASGIGGRPQASQPAIRASQEIRQADDARRMVEALRTSGVPVYAIAPRGLASLFGPGDSGERAQGTTRGTTAAQMAAASSLRQLADLTGGLALANSNSLEPFFDAIARDTNTYYVLGYAPPAGLRPGTDSAIQVRVNRRDVEVRARKTFRLPASAAPLGR